MHPNAKSCKQLLLLLQLQLLTALLTHILTTVPTCLLYLLIITTYGKSLLLLLMRCSPGILMLINRQFSESTVNIFTQSTGLTRKLPPRQPLNSLSLSLSFWLSNFLTTLEGLTIVLLLKGKASPWIWFEFLSRNFSKKSESCLGAASYSCSYSYR